MTDEVYEHLVFPGAVHIPLATLPGMGDRTLTISSGGKTFNTTGWKVGWMCGPEPIVTAARTAKQFLTYVNAGPFQPAIATGLDLGDDFYAGLAADLTTKRDHLVAGLDAAGFETFVPEATYFTTVDIRPVDPAGDGIAFCRSLPERCGVVAIPNEVFYARPEHGRHLVRFACCKRLSVLDEAADGWRRSARGGSDGHPRVAAIQHDIVWNDRDANFARLAPLIGAAAAAGAGLVLCTETFSTGFVVDGDLAGEPEGGPSSSFLVEQAARARRLGRWLLRRGRPRRR